MVYRRKGDIFPVVKDKACIKLCRGGNPCNKASDKILFFSGIDSSGSKKFIRNSRQSRRLCRNKNIPDELPLMTCSICAANNLVRFVSLKSEYRSVYFYR